MRRQDRQVVAYEQVTCLECGHRYAKPSDGGTMGSNPGCPRCGYVGWIAVRHRGNEDEGDRMRRAG